MFLLDNLLVGPGKAALFVFKELARKAQEDWLDDDSVKQELQEIYALVEAGNISTQDFEARECRLLERLEQIAKAKYRDKWGQQDSAGVIDSLPLIEAAPVVEQSVRFDDLTIEAAAPPPPPPAPPPPPPPTPSAAAPPPVPAAAPVPPTWNYITAPQFANPPVVTAPVMPPPVMATAMMPPPMMAPPFMPQPVAPPPMAMPLTGLSITQVVESASRALALLNLKVSAITSVSPSEDGWRVTAELIERKGVPDTNDQIGVYELRLDAAGNVMRYERTRLRRRGDLGR
jgi:hypothetical protein